MSREQWQQIEQLYDSALKLKPAQRRAFLEETCGTDEELRREVESLLAFDEQAQDFLEVPALEMASTSFAQQPSAPDREALADGTEIGPYRILASLGSGGMGEVYRATDTRLGRDVALKLLPGQAAKDPHALERFRREAHAASALDHPNICTLHDIGEYEGRPFLVMERLEGKSLKQCIAEKHFAPGSMLPKIQAAVLFAKSKPGRRAIITSLDKAVDALHGAAGTTITL